MIQEEIKMEKSQVRGLSFSQCVSYNFPEIMEESVKSRN